MSESLQAYQDSLNNILKEIIERITQYDEDDPRRYDEWKDCNKEFKDILEAVNLLKKYTPPFMNKDLPPWLQDVFRERWRALRKVSIVITYIYNHTAGITRSKNLADKYCKGKMFTTEKGGKYTYLTFYTDWEKMCTELKEDGLDITVQTLKLYIRELEKGEFIDYLGRYGSRGNNIYGAGYWSGYRKVMFFQMAERKEHIINALKQFKLR